MKKNNLCWCESGTDYLSCHGRIKKRVLYPVNGLILPLDKDTPNAVKTNFINYLKNLDMYSFADEGNYLGFDYNGKYVDFYNQEIITKNSIKNGYFRIPSIFLPWAKEAKNLDSGFIDENRKKLKSITRIRELIDLHDLKKHTGYLFISSAEKQTLRDNVGIISSKFIELFPEGSIDFISISNCNFVLPILIRNFSKQKILGIGVTKDLLKTNWKEHLPANDQGNYFDILFNLFESGVYGFTIPWLDRNLLLTFGTTLRLGDAEYLSKYVNGTDYGYLEAGVKITTEKFALTPSDFRVFTGWYIMRLNDLLNYLYCFASFANKKDLNLNPVEQYKYIITFEQITSLLLKILGTNDLMIKKQLTLIFLDLVSKLRFGSGGSVDKIFFKSYIDELNDNLDNLPIQFNIQYKKHVTLIFQKLFDEVIDEVIPFYKKDNGIETPSRKFSFNEYVGAYISALRNSIHGIHGSSEKDFDEVVFINSGEVPSYLPNIAAIIYLNILIKPELYFRSQNLPLVPTKQQINLVIETHN